MGEEAAGEPSGAFLGELNRAWGEIKKEGRVALPFLVII